MLVEPVETTRAISTGSTDGTSIQRRFALIETTPTDAVVSS